VAEKSSGGRLGKTASAIVVISLKKEKWSGLRFAQNYRTGREPDEALVEDENLSKDQIFFREFMTKGRRRGWVVADCCC
jgi:hypothetical protein